MFIRRIRGLFLFFDAISMKYLLTLQKELPILQTIERNPLQ